MAVEALSTMDSSKERCKIGDTMGAVLLLENVSVSRGPRDIIKCVNWRVEKGERWGIVGANGSGKASLCICLFGFSKNDFLIKNSFIKILSEYTVGCHNWIN